MDDSVEITSRPQARHDFHLNWWATGTYVTRKYHEMPAPLIGNFPHARCIADSSARLYRSSKAEMICHRHNHTRQTWAQRLTGLVCLSLALAIIRLGGTVAVGPVTDDRAVRVCRPESGNDATETVLWTGRHQIQPYATTADTCLL